nr:MAG TPA: YopX protein [Caudoviricetes sp.]
MREIKFRVWDNIAKKYIDGKHVSISGLGLLHVAKRIIKNCFRPLHTRKNPWFIVEQYTGLKDINGTEIYGGDIIVQKSLGSNKSGCRGKITYKEDHAAFMFEVYERGKPVMWLFLNEFNPEKTCEVIGNIHENPELLEERG